MVKKIIEQKQTQDSDAHKINSLYLYDETKTYNKQVLEIAGYLHCDLTI